MTKNIMTGISPNYVKGWTVETAIREIVQNYLDSRKEFGCEGSITYKDGIAIVKDNGPGLQIKHLALGVSEKGGDSIGKYGEGLKLALLVLAREGRYVEVRARGMVIKPNIVMDENFGTEVLALEISDMAPRHAATHTGTTVKFACLPNELKRGKSYFTAFLGTSSSDYGFKWIEKDRISLPGGYVYINGAKVGGIENALFSYHLNESETGDIGNRDREVIDHDKIRSYIRGLLGITHSTQVMRALIDDATGDGRSWEIGIGGINHYHIPNNYRKVWRRAWNEVVGKDTVIDSGEEEARVQANYLGYRVARISNYGWTEAFKAIGIQTTTQVTVGKVAMQKVAIDKLTSEERKTLKTACKLVEKHYNEIGNLSVSEKLSAGAEGSDTLGLYKRDEDRIYILRSVLTDLPKTVHILLHEAVHKHSGAMDCTSQFERALTDVAVAMMIK